ncbi:MAG: hypothetical protein Kow00121_60000 [Elainellaceae cyanobacterium]
MLAALGFSEAGFSLLAERYQQVLAQPTRRKLALLIGINQYPDQVCDCTPSRGTALNGCLTDVELQRELLIHRFGFQPTDILTLTDLQATRKGIEEAFLAHLVEQVRPGDVVVFHFSGLGSQVHWEQEGRSGNSLVPVDGLVPTPENPVINDIPEETLGLLLRSLPTEQLTALLDVGYTNLGKILQGNLRVRSRPNAPTGQLNEAELALQERLFGQLQVTKDQIRAQWQSGQLPGVVLMAAKANQIAAEAQWNGFSCGLFTYALTQQLWWSTSATTLRTSLSLAAGTVKQSAGIEQQPALAGQRTADQKLSAYNLTLDTPNADGVIQAVEEDNKVQLWLAGLPTPVLENYGASIVAVTAAGAGSSPSFTLTEFPPASPPASAEANSQPETKPTAETEAISTSPPTPLLLQIRSRDGLIFKARPCCKDIPAGSMQAGQLVQEIIRILPRNIGLTIALDASLERIERVDATSAFSSIPRVSSVIAGEPADFLFGKTQLDPTLTAALSPLMAASKRGYGLFSLGRDAIPNTLIQEDEAVKTAITRIAPQLRTLLALKLLRLTANRGSSRLGIQATLEMTAPQERILMQQGTVRSPWTLPDRQDVKTRLYTADLFTSDGMVSLPLNSRIRYRLQNFGDQPVYYMLLGLDTKGNPLTFMSSAETSVIPAQETLIVPQSMSDWIVQGLPGLAETHLIFSRAPFTQSRQALQAASKTEVRQVMMVQNPLDLVQTILQDLHRASAEVIPKVDIPTDTYALGVNAWATLSFVYQVIEA